MIQQSTKIGKQSIMSTATYKCLSSFTNANFVTRINHQKTETQMFKSRDQDLSLENHNCSILHM